LVLLTGYAAKRCARRIHNEWDPAIEQVEWEVPPEVQMRFDAGIAFEATIFAELKAALPAGSWVDLSDVRGKDAAIAATLAALKARTPVVLGGWLPDDTAGGRTGKPDILLHVGAGAYVPGDVKAHKMTAPRARGTLAFSLPSAPTQVAETAGYAVEKTGRLDDYLQIAHYWRMLEAIDRTPKGSARGFIIGTDLLADVTDRHVLCWVDLEAKVFETYSRSEGKAKRSALERYDHELGFRIKVARTAAAGEPALVQPIFTDECDSCAWYDYCLGVADPDDPSAAITAGRLTIREWQALARAGITTVGALAELDPTDPTFLATYEPEVSHVRDAPRRLADAVRRARMIRDGVEIQRETTGPIDVPRADIEIDFDIEWDTGDQVYLWGALVTRDGVDPTYHPVVSWSEMTETEASELAGEFAGWLHAEIAEADAAGKSLLVYHYSNPEPNYLTKVLGAQNVADLLEHFVDLLPIVRANFFGLHGLGIKKVAPAFGFRWRDEDPGGLQSQLWLVEARKAEDPQVRETARRRILEYNEDDVRATAAVRNGLGDL
jgi:predicted RecB family nuclease